MGVSNVKHKTRRGSLCPCHFYPIQLLTGGNQAQILAGEKDFRSWGWGGFISIPTIACQASTLSVTPSSGVCSCSRAIIGKGKNHRQHVVSTAPECPRLHSRYLAPATETVRAKIKTQIHENHGLSFQIISGSLLFGRQSLNGLYWSQETWAAVAVVKAHSQHSPIFTCFHGQHSTD